MKICLATSGGEGMKDSVSMNFGRCPYFTIVEIDENKDIKSVRVVQNPGGSAGSGAGVQAAQTVADNE